MTTTTATRTLAALDRELARGQRFAGLLDDLCRIPQAACNLRQRMRELAPRPARSRRPRGGVGFATRRRSSRGSVPSRAAKRQNFGLPSDPGCIVITANFPESG